MSGAEGPAAGRSGEWFLHWAVMDLDRPTLTGEVSAPWSPWRRWLHLFALEGRPIAPWRQGTEEGTDPTP